MAKTPKKKAELRLVDALDTAERLFVEGFREIPPCSVDLIPAAQAIYDNYCRMLLKRGMFTVHYHQAAENYAIGKHMSIKVLNAGKNAPRQATEMMRSAERVLRPLGLNDEIQTPAAEHTNPFAGFGFAKRSRQARNG